MRTILTRQLRPRSLRRPKLQAIAGGRDRRASGRDHDRWFYGPGAQA